MTTRRRQATLTLVALQRLAKAERAALAEEGERMFVAAQPDAKAHGVLFA